jgi:hypothetical protein
MRNIIFGDEKNIAVILKHFNTNSYKFPSKIQSISKEITNQMFAVKKCKYNF